MVIDIFDIKDLIKRLSSYYKKKSLYLVGGTIRDILLGIKPKDFDLFVIGSGIRLAQDFAEDTGGRFILLEEKMDEARVVVDDLTFDFNGGYSIYEDLMRRDFTMNSMALRLPFSRIIDPFKGIRDMRRGIVRAVSEKNIVDDPLRILRAFRFKALFDFAIESRTRCMMIKNRHRLKDIARERIKTELLYILGSRSSWQALMDMADMKVLDEIIPQFSALRGIPQNKPYGDLVNHSINTVRALEELDIGQLPFPEIFQEYFNKHTAVLKLACLLHDIGKPRAFEVQNDRVHFYGHEKTGVEIVKEGLKLSKEEKNIITKLIALHMRPHLLASDPYYTRRAVVRLISSSGRDAPGLLLLSLADAIASAGSYLDGLNRVFKDSGEVMTQREEIKERLITGDDLITLGIKPGPIFREILTLVEEERALGNLPTKEDAISYIKKRWL